jgi:hypothetical protein
LVKAAPISLYFSEFLLSVETSGRPTKKQSGISTVYDSSHNPPQLRAFAKASALRRGKPVRYLMTFELLTSEVGQIDSLPFWLFQESRNFSQKASINRLSVY